MQDSSAAATPYEVLGVDSSASDDELRRAYRRALRHAHPDVGGSAQQFQSVQNAWERVGTPESRASYDRQRFSQADAESTAYSNFGGSGARAAGASAGQASQSSLKARMHGYPGGLSRAVYLSLIREWSGRGTTLEDPYAPDLIRRAPREVRHSLAKALAEENTAQLISNLGIGFTAWHDVDAGDRADKIDHVVLGPAGLFAVLSEDWGSPVELRRGELVGDGIGLDEEPIEYFVHAARAFSRALRVRFTALIVVLPDHALYEPLTIPGRGRRPSVIIVPRARLTILLRNGLPGLERGSFEKIFELRSQLQNGVRFVSV